MYSRAHSSVIDFDAGHSGSLAGGGGLTGDASLAAAQTAPTSLAATTQKAPAHGPQAAPPELSQSMAATTGSLLLVVALIVGLGWLLRRMQGMRLQGGALIRVLASQALGHKERVVMVQVGDTQLLVGVTGQQINLLHRFEAPISAAAATTEPDLSPFARRLRQFMQRENN